MNRSLENRVPKSSLNSSTILTSSYIKLSSTRRHEIEGVYIIFHLIRLKFTLRLAKAAARIAFVWLRWHSHTENWGTMGKNGDEHMISLLKNNQETRIRVQFESCVPDSERLEGEIIPIDRRQKGITPKLKRRVKSHLTTDGKRMDTSKIP